MPIQAPAGDHLKAMCALRDALQEGTFRSPDEPWSVAKPESVGVSEVAIDRAIDELTSGHHISSMLLIKDGKLIVERYGCTKSLDPRLVLDAHPMRPNERLITFSFTKSVTGLLAGLAIHDGLLKLDSKVLDVLQVTPANPSPAKSSLTLEHMLIHRCGLEWEHEDDVRMPTAPNGVQYVLDRPMTSDPGTKWHYNTGCSHLIGALVQKVTGSAARFAEDRLFHPMGIRGATWTMDAQGIPLGGSGLMITPRDMARFGVLMLNKGRVGDQQIVPAEWIEQSLTPRTPTEWVHDYGYHWWILGGPHDPKSPRGFGARGAFGQNMYVLEDLKTIVLFTSGIPIDEADRTLEEFLFTKLAPLLGGKGDGKS
jgi:CubicO group peptidase (beta-lactamase class C family)